MSHVKFTESELETQIQKIMESFNFQKVLDHMIATDHKWYMGSIGMQVPDMEDLRNNARSILVRAAYDKEPNSNAGTGGFMAYKLPWGMSLTFQLVWS